MGCSGGVGLRRPTRSIHHRQRLHANWLLVWGGHDSAGAELVDGAAYDPALDRWRRIADFPFDYERLTGVGVGEDGFYERYNVPGTWFDGEAVFIVRTGDEHWAWDLVGYDPATDSWRLIHPARFDPVTSGPASPDSAPVQAPTGLATVGGELFLFGWDTVRSELGWTSLDVATETWSPFSGIAGSGELDGFAGVTSEPVLVADRYLVWLREHGIAADGLPLGYAVDLTRENVVRVDVPAGVVPDSGIDLHLGDLSASGVVVGTTLSGGDLARKPFAAQLDPAPTRDSHTLTP